MPGKRKVGVIPQTLGKRERGVEGKYPVTP